MAETAKPVAEGRDKPSDVASVRTHAAAEAAPRKPPEIEDGAEASARALGDVTRRVIEQGQAAIQLGLERMTTAQVPIAETSYRQGRRAVEAVAEVTSYYRDAAERTAGELQRLGACSAQIALGTLHFQHAWFEAMHHALDRLGNKPQDLFASSSPAEAARLQRDIYGELVSSMVSSTATLLQIAAETSQGALHALQPPPAQR